MRLAAVLTRVALASALTFPGGLPAQDSHPLRPFGTLREQAAMQQQWLRQRMETVLPTLMRKYGVDMWVVPMREYNEDPVFSSIVSPTTLAARRRTIYVFFDRGPEAGVERLALGGTSQGGVYTAFRSQRAVPGTVPGNVRNARQAELDGDDQW
ncbi:MAG: Xaa-Pro aminopeptidase, partial [Gemmatimonadota bacterium]|nr:Xaa-Pro aminopeptidase [Gemmatimonadota bacterium]